MKGVIFVCVVILGISSMGVSLKSKRGGLGGGCGHHQMGMHGHDGLHHRVPMCLSQNLTLPTNMKSIYMQCHREASKSLAETMGEHHFPSQKQRACRIVCVAQGLGLLNKDGQPSGKDEVEKIIMPVFPKEAMGKVMETLTSCAATNGKDLMVKENDCGSYIELINCIIPQIKETCGIPTELF